MYAVVSLKPVFIRSLEVPDTHFAGGMFKPCFEWNSYKDRFGTVLNNNFFDAKYISHCGCSIENNITSDIRLSRNVWSTRDLKDHDVSCAAASPAPPTQCYLGYAYTCSNRPHLFSKSLVCKVNTAQPFSFVYKPFSATPFSAKVWCVKSIRVDLFLLLRKGHFGNTHGVRPFSE